MPAVRAISWADRLYILKRDAKWQVVRNALGGDWVGSNPTTLMLTASLRAGSFVLSEPMSAKRCLVSHLTVQPEARRSTRKPNVSFDTLRKGSQTPGVQRKNRVLLKPFERKKIYMAFEHSSIVPVSYPLSGQKTPLDWAVGVGYMALYHTPYCGAH